jgi:alpha-ketoglutarate-dependent taurine dioxygenase
MEAVALRLMNVDNSSAGSYNGKGGVVRKSIDGTGFVDSAAGAPKEVTIQFHNEMAYATSFPKYVTFAMVRQAQADGTTTLADNLAVQRLMSDKLQDKFRTLGVQYIRHLHDEAARDAPDFYTSWQGAFLTDSMEEAMKRGNDSKTFSILEKHADGRRLTHTLWCPVYHEHPEHGELFFNSVLNRHASWLDTHPYWKTVPNAERPYQCVWGDGTEFSEEELAEIRKVYDDSTVYLRLEPGDVLVVDNLRVVHGRTPYSGSRLLGLLLSDTVERGPCQPPGAFAKLLQRHSE